MVSGCGGHQHGGAVDTVGGRSMAGLAAVVVSLATMVAPVAAKSGPTTTTTTNPPPPGYHTVTVKKAAVSVAVPDAWSVFDLTTKTGRADWTTLKESSAGFARALSGGQAQGYVLYAVNPQEAGALWLSVNFGFGAGYHLFSPRETATNFRKHGVTDAAVAPTKVAGLPANEATYTGGNLPDGSPTHVTTYFFGTKNRAYAIAFHSLDDGRTDPTTQAMIASVKIG